MRPEEELNASIVDVAEVADRLIGCAAGAGEVEPRNHFGWPILAGRFVPHFTSLLSQ